MGKAAIFGERKIKPSARNLTLRQREVLYFMWLFFLNNDQLPPMQNITDAFGWKSTNAAQCFADVLAAKGYIEPNACPGKWRFTTKAREVLADAR